MIWTINALLSFFQKKWTNGLYGLCHQHWNKKLGEDQHKVALKTSPRNPLVTAVGLKKSLTCDNVCTHATWAPTHTQKILHATIKKHISTVKQNWRRRWRVCFVWPAILWVNCKQNTEESQGICLWFKAHVSCLSNCHETWQCKTVH